MGRIFLPTHIKSAICHQLQKRGLAIKPSAASVWIHGSAPHQFEAAREIITGLVDDEPQLRLFLTSANQDTVSYLWRRFPDEQPVTLPATRFLPRFIAKTRPGLLVLLDNSLDNLALDAIRRNGIHIATPEPTDSVENILRTLRPLRPAPPNRAIAEAWIRGTWRDRAGQSRFWQIASRWWTTKRIDNIDALRQALGSPRTIVCLGNGPSSEDPRLLGIEHDCLMRVNWRWRDRGFLTRPDVVFVGDAHSLHKVAPPIFAFWNRPIESGGLLRHLVTRGPKRMTYFTVERLSPIIGERNWWARPTNGALMIITAAALAPERLVIAGIDLFQHPDGRYPGDQHARNEYSRCHNRNLELELIDLALRDYKGEVVILSENLARMLERHRETKNAPVT